MCEREVNRLKTEERRRGRKWGETVRDTEFGGRQETISPV
jgi:hypothetical protein